MDLAVTEHIIVERGLSQLLTEASSYKITALILDGMRVVVRLHSFCSKDTYSMFMGDSGRVTIENDLRGFFD